MSKPWFPRVVDGGRRARRPLPREWRRDRHRRLRFSPAETRLTILAGLFLGLVAFQSMRIGPDWTGTETGSGPEVVRASPAMVRVIDGDTFDYAGTRVRVADIDTPELRGRCAFEIQLAARATRRMGALLAAGPFELHPIPGRDEDRYGRKLRVVTRDGRSLGDRLVAEGLARTWTGRREPWC